MRRTALAAFIALLAGVAHADTMAHCSAAWKAKSAEAAAAASYSVWSKRCLGKGYIVSTAASMIGRLPEDATAQSKDGTYVTSKLAPGRCSHHGGVARVR